MNVPGNDFKTMCNKMYKLLTEAFSGLMSIVILLSYEPEASP